MNMAEALRTQPFYKQGLYQQLGFNTLEEFHAGFWEKRFLRRDANNLIPEVRFRVIPSVWGHQAGNGLNAADSAFIDAELKKLLAS